MKAIAIAIGLIGLCGPALAQGQFAAPALTPQKDGKQVIARHGQWMVERDQNPMTDKVDCTGYHSSSRRVQLSTDDLYFSFRGKGGVRGYQLRFDDNPATALRLASDTEKRVGAIIIPIASSPALTAKRLRITTVTLLDTQASDDLDISGIDAAHAVISSPICK